LKEKFSQGFFWFYKSLSKTLFTFINITIYLYSVYGYIKYRL
jgi:hypothetical protein